MKKYLVFYLISFFLILFIGSCSSSEIPGDSGESTILTGKKASYLLCDFQTEINGIYKSQGKADFNEFPFYKDEFEEMKDLNGDGVIKGELKHLIDKYPELNKHVQDIIKHTEYEIPWNARAYNNRISISFGKSKGKITLNECELLYSKGDKIKCEKYEIQFQKKDVKESAYTINSSSFTFKEGNKQVSKALEKYRYVEPINSIDEGYQFDFRDAKKNWTTTEMDCTYKIEDNSILIETKELTFSGTIYMERRYMVLKQTYPSSSETMYFDIEF